MRRAVAAGAAMTGAILSLAAGVARGTEDPGKAAAPRMEFIRRRRAATSSRGSSRYPTPFFSMAPGMRSDCRR